jgi:class 3 adenylate cyclase
MANDTPYRIEKDEKGLVRTIYSCQDGQEIPVPIDADGREYCRFVTWACNQDPPIAESFAGLEANALYLAQEEDLVDFCKRNAVVLYVLGPSHDERHFPTRLVGGPAHTELTFVYHTPDVVANSAGEECGRISFYRLYQSKATYDMIGSGEVDGLWWQPLPVFVTHTLLARIEDALRQPNSDIRCLSSWPVEKTFVYVDISGFSQHLVGHQVVIINSLLDIVNDDRWWPTDTLAKHVRADREASLCIGDGYIFVFGRAEYGTHFAACLAYLIENLVARKWLTEFHFRIGVHTGPVYRFWDQSGATNGRWNYIGRGITDGQRVLSAIGDDQDDVVFISAETRQELLREAVRVEAAHLLINRGRRADKHRQFRRVYEVNHSAWADEYLDYTYSALPKHPPGYRLDWGESDRATSS